jgi:hypothetical protein
MSDVSGNMAAAAVVAMQRQRVVFQKQKVHEPELLCWLLQRARMLPADSHTDSLLFSLFIYPGQHTSSCPAHPQREKSCSFERKTHYKALAIYSHSLEH